MKFKNKLFLLLAVSAVTAACESSKEKKEERQEIHEHETAPVKDRSGSLSPHTEAMAIVDGAHVHIDYSAPSVRDRIIFGGLVAFDRVWQAGAHNATWIETDKDLEIGESILPAGKYGFFLIPRKQDEWSVIFNSRWEQHGKDDYNEAEDVLRFNVTPQESKEPQEVLKYEVNKTGEKTGDIVFSWEKKKIIIPFRVK
ncbi:DUF2911 domain-containing protein [Salinimicrobium xinjiangense]|uniref:DUF2911 domain-containing protein n=1 Tax=Salinimicrobium xinjiangense TaxID=438596 RepID=UPI0004242B65|nr:DUF2911 domain-containing protein [Salinimicrobium xinjiangense]